MAQKILACFFLLASVFICPGMSSNYRERSRDVDGMPYDSIPDNYADTVRRADPETPGVLPDSFEPGKLPNHKVDIARRDYSFGNSFKMLPDRFEPDQLPSKKRSEMEGNVRVKNIGSVLPDSFKLPNHKVDIARRDYPFSHSFKMLPDRFEPDKLPSKRSSEKVGNVRVKNIGKYTFITKKLRNDKFSCLCKKGPIKVWAGICGVADKNFNYKNCV